MNEEIEKLDQQLQLLISIPFPGMSDAEKQRLQDSATEIRAEYMDAVQKRDAKDADAATKKKYSDACDAIAKGLPNITKGALAAASAFKSGDYMNGTAAIMDICASAAPMIGSLFAAGGPPGALIGALFSMIGQLLTFFGPKQPSLKDEILKLMLNVEAEAKLRTMLAVGDSIDVYAAKLTAAAAKIPDLLKMPLQTGADADEFHMRCKALQIGLARDQNRMDVPAFNNWEVMEWLRSKDRQDLDKWPEVLAVFCRSYTKLVNANVTFNCLTDANRIYAVLADTSESNSKSPLLPNTRHDIHKLILKLQSMAIAFSEDWKAYNKKVLELMADIEQGARFRGLFLHLGGKGFLYAGSGRKSLVDENGWTYLSADRDRGGSGYGYIQKMAVALSVADEALDSPTPAYHCVLQRDDGNIHGRLLEHRRIDATSPPRNRDAHNLPTWFVNRGMPSIKDTWAIPGGWPDKPKEVWIYLATGSKISSVELNEDNVLENRGWGTQDAKLPLESVRCIYPESVRDDPDGNLLQFWPGLTAKANAQIHYGGMAGSPEIFVVTHHDGVHDYVPTPWANYAGIGVDKKFLWVFGTGGLACATHTSVLRAVRERRKGNQASKPRWIEHYPNQLLYKGLPVGNALVGPRKDEPALKGFHDLAPCDDGTLTAVLHTRQYDGSGKLQREEGPHMYTTSYEVNTKLWTIEVSEWTKLHGEAQQVLKQPIYCWPLVEGLKLRLVAEGKSG